MFVGAIFEALGIGIIIPALNVITNENPIKEYPYLIFFTDIFDAYGEDDLLTIIIIFIVLIYTFKFLYLSFLYFIQSHLCHKIQASLSENILSNYLSKPYSFHINSNSSIFLRNALQESVMFTSHVLMPAMMLIIELFTIIFIAGLLFYFYFIPTASVLIVMTIVISLYYFITKIMIKSWGQKRLSSDALRIKYLQEASSLVKELIIYGKQSSYVDTYSIPNRNSAYYIANLFAINQIPRLLLEFIFIMMIAVLIYYFIGQKENSYLLSMIGLFGVASFRLLPSVSRIMSCYQSLVYGSQIVEVLSKYQKKDYIDTNNENDIAVSFKRNISLNNLSFRYEDTDNEVLENINLNIKKDDMIAFIGESGSGKSTLSDVIMSLLAPEKGKIIVDDIDISTSRNNYLKLFSYVPQSVVIIDDTIKANIALLNNGDIDNNSLNKAIELSGLKEYVSSLSKGINTIVGEDGSQMSGGQRQRLGIARALYSNSPILILDEVTSSLDAETEKRFINTLEKIKRTRTIIIIAHKQAVLKHCDQIYRIKNKSIEEFSG